jgi:CHAT domain-containing protein
MIHRMIHRYPRSIQSMCGSGIIFCNLILSITLPLVHMGASSAALYHNTEVKTAGAAMNQARETQQIRQLVPGRPIVRDLAGAQSHSYQMTLAAGQYVRVVIDQRGIDVVVKLIGPDGRQIREFDADGSPQGREIVSWVTEEAGIYRLDVGAMNKAASAGQYVIQPVVLRVAKEDERALYEAGNLITESRRLFLAGKYDEAIQLIERVREIREKMLGPEHPDTGNALNQLARLYAAKGDIAQALIFMAGANYVDERNLNIASGWKRQKSEYLDQFDRRTDFTLSLQNLTAPNDQQALDLAFTTLLRRKASRLDAMIDPLAAFRAQDKELFDKLGDARSQLADLRSKEPDAYGSESFRKRVKPLEEKISQITGELSARSAEFRANTQPVTLDAIQAELPSDSALVEFAHFTPVDPKTGKSKPPRYFAYVLATRGKAKWIDLGEATMIDQAVNLWRAALRSPNRADADRLARAVDEKTMQPVRSFLGEMPGDARRLLIAPDGSLNLIPFAALVDEQNRYLIERYTISYLTTGRDLLRLQSPQPSKGDPLVVANPDFGSSTAIAEQQDRGKPQSGNQAREEREAAPTFFSPLPGTTREALAIKELLPKASVLQREEASEAALEQVRGPRILHLATHGFFLDNQDAATAEVGPARAGSPEDTEFSQANPYTVQFEAAPAFETANEKIKVLKAQGVDAYIVKGTVKGKGDFFRVRAGNFPSIAEANKYGADLQKKGVVTEFFVTRYEPPVTSQPVTEPLPNLRLSKFAMQETNPLLRAGLALAGANQSKSGDDDGVLTALEAAGLDLLGTKLVVLSACDTGVGDMKNGEGVQGLRRALVLAGSESQVISLWPVSDESIKELMIPYYKGLQQGQERTEGLRQVQLRMLRERKDLRHPFYWAMFIQSGEWANLDGKR